MWWCAGQRHDARGSAGPCPLNWRGAAMSIPWAPRPTSRHHSPDSATTLHTVNDHHLGVIVCSFEANSGLLENPAIWSCSVHHIDHFITERSCSAAQSEI